MIDFKPRIKINVYVSSDTKAILPSIRDALFSDGDGSEGLCVEVAIRILRDALCHRSISTVLRQELRRQAYIIRDAAETKQASVKCNARVSPEAFEGALSDIEAVLYAGSQKINRRVCVESSIVFLAAVLSDSFGAWDVLRLFLDKAVAETTRLYHQAKIQAGMMGAARAREVTTLEERQRYGRKGGRVKAKKAASQ